MEKERYNYQYKSMKMSWQKFMPYKIDMDHPKSIEEFIQLEVEIELGINLSQLYNPGFIKMINNEIKESKWLKSWEKILAVGPFVNRPRRLNLNAVPIVLVANYRRPYRHLLALSKILAPVYLEYSILPDLYLMHVRTIREFESNDNPNWLRTKKLSIQWGGILNA